MDLQKLKTEELIYVVTNSKDGDCIQLAMNALGERKDVQSYDLAYLIYGLSRGNSILTLDQPAQQKMIKRLLGLPDLSVHCLLLLLCEMTLEEEIVVVLVEALMALPDLPASALSDAAYCIDDQASSQKLAQVYCSHPLAQVEGLIQLAGMDKGSVALIACEALLKRSDIKRKHLWKLLDAVIVFPEARQLVINALAVSDAEARPDTVEYDSDDDFVTLVVDTICKG